MPGADGKRCRLHKPAQHLKPHETCREVAHQRSALSAEDHPPCLSGGDGRMGARCQGLSQRLTPRQGMAGSERFSETFARREGEALQLCPS